MAMQVGQAEDDDLNSQINTTPLVDVMLVLLKERNLPTQTKPENIVIAVDRDGNVFWNNQFVDDAQLLKRLKDIAVLKPQPEVHIRGDREGRYEFVGRVVYNCQRAGILKIGFITEPPPRSGCVRQLKEATWQ